MVDTDYEGLGFRVETESHRKKFSKECRQQMKLVTAQIFRQRDSKILDHSFESLDSSSMWWTQIIRFYGLGFYQQLSSLRIGTQPL